MANCKDCLHVEVCKDYAINYLKGTPIEALEKEVGDYPCCRFQDRSLFVESPCKVGDTLFVPTRNFISEYEIEYFHFGKYGIWFNTKLIKGISTRLRNAHIEAIGKDVFLTREEAEQTLNKTGDKNV